MQDSILSGFAYQDLLYESARNRAREWGKKRQQLLEMGKSQEYIEAMGKKNNNEKNWQNLLLELEDRKDLEENGLDPSESPYSTAYVITSEDYEHFYRYLAVRHCLLIGILADISFFSRSRQNTPLLPEILPYFLERYNNSSFPPEFWQKVISATVELYEGLYNSLNSDCFPLSIELKMQFAQSLANLPPEYHYLALQQGNSAVYAWLKSNGIAENKVFDLDNDEDCQLLKSIIYQEDKPFFNSLKELMAKVDEGEVIELEGYQRIKVILSGWQNLIRWGDIPQLPNLEKKNKQNEGVLVKSPYLMSPQKTEKNFVEILPNDINLEMVVIPEGEFIMGSRSHYRASPVIKVALPEFYISKYPITQAQYEAIMGNNPSFFQNPERAPLYEIWDNHPVESVDWNDVVEFCKKLSNRTGKKYTLPTEEQWEYACRAGSHYNWFFGNNLNEHKLEDYAWYYSNSKNQTHPVGLKTPNAWGLHDMYGNVLEWCNKIVSSHTHGHSEGEYGTSYNTIESFPSMDNLENNEICRRKNPDPFFVFDSSTSLPFFPNNDLRRYSESRWLRGGSYRAGSSYCNSAHRYVHKFLFNRDDHRNNNPSQIGFRVVCFS